MVSEQREREDKYDVDQAFDLPRLQSLIPRGGRLRRSEVRLRSQYFDTDHHDLLHSKVTLRERSGDADVGWQLKLPEQPGARIEVRRPATESSAVPDDLADLVQGLAGGRRLQPVAVVTTDRVVHDILDANDTVVVEIADDQVRAVATGSAATISRWREVEVELGAGDERTLAAVGKRLRRAGARPSAASSKLARALAAPGVRLPAEPGHPDFEHAGGVVGHYIAAQYQAILFGDVSLRRGGEASEDAIHDTRVATRRLRGTLRVDGRLFDPTRAAGLDAELAWYAQTLGRVRDAQVQHAHFAEALADLPPELVLGSVGNEIRQRLLVEELAGREALARLLHSERYFGLLGQLRDWVADPPYQPTAGRKANSLGRIARRAERKAGRRLRQALRRTDDRDVALHRARKAAKRARYALEVASPVLDRGRSKRSLKRLKDLQDALGEHQDSVIARGFLRELATRSGAEGQNGFTYGLLHERERQLAARAEARAAKLAR